jgi:hypothetical protein
MIRRPIRLRATARTETQARIELSKLLEKARDGRSPEAGVTMAKLLDEYAPIAQWDVSTRQTNGGFIRRPRRSTRRGGQCRGRPMRFKRTSIFVRHRST